MYRFDCLKILASRLKDELCVVGLGGLVDEWTEVYPASQSLPLNAMGCVVSMALGVAVGLPNRRIVAIDGEGSMLMNLGILATLGNEAPTNLLTVIFDNSSYESSGGFATHTGENTDIAQIARGAGIGRAHAVSELAEFEAVVEDALSTREQTFVVARVEKGTRLSPQRETDGIEDKYNFVRHIEKLESTRIITLLPRKKYDVEFQ
jgi:thiamine pyrophosphate-dependent acetolactate synthase large subunit-like protein